MQKQKKKHLFQAPEQKPRNPESRPRHPGIQKNRVILAVRTSDEIFFIFTGVPHFFVCGHGKYGESMNPSLQRDLELIQVLLQQKGVI